MRQRTFEIRSAPLTAAYRDRLAALEEGGRHPPDSGRYASFPELHRRVCAHYALARSRGYSPGLVAELELLVRRGHRQLYRRRAAPLGAAMAFMIRDFPGTLRRHLGLLGIAAILFLGPLAGMTIAVREHPHLVYSLLDATEVAEIESMYETPEPRPEAAERRGVDTDVAMFGYYVMNNVGVGFRTFAGGLVLGLGTVLALVYNGLHLGAVAGHLTRWDFGPGFWPFVSGHAPYELTAIAICGAAGLLLGQALVAPGERTRLAALRANARDAVVLVGGAAILLVFAAVVEAFWSAGPAPAELKYGLGAVGWALVATYIGLAGRDRTDAS